MKRPQEGLFVLVFLAIALSASVLYIQLRTLEIPPPAEDPPGEPSRREVVQRAYRLRTKARRYADAGDLIRAVVRVRRALELTPESLSGTRQLADYLRQQGRTDAAIETFQRAIELCETDGAAWAELADTLAAARRHADALAAYERMLSLGFRPAEAHMGAGRMLARMERNDDAVAQFRQASEMAPERYDAVVPGLDVDRVRSDVERLRGLIFLHEPRVVFQSRETTIRNRVDWVRRQVAHYGEGITASPTAGGDGVFDAEDVGRASAEDTAAFYRASEHRIYVVTDNLSASRLSVLLAHELMHGLQEERLADLAPTSALRTGVANFDRGLALECLQEGDAEFVEQAVRNEQDKGLYGYGAINAAAESLTSSRSVSRWLRRHYEDADDDGARSVPVLGLGVEYRLGAFLVASAWQRGGWETVNALYERPPSSTEQCLHPDKLLSGASRDEPSVVYTPHVSATGWRRSTVATFGEIGLLRSLRRHGVPFADARRMAAGWDGDLRATWRNAAGDVATTTTIVFDTEEDAVEFVALFRRWRGGVAIEGEPALPRTFEFAPRGFITNRTPLFVTVLDGFPREAATEFLEGNLERAALRH